MTAYTFSEVGENISIRIGHNHQENVHFTKDTGHRSTVFLKVYGNLESQKYQERILKKYIFYRFISFVCICKF